MMKKKMMFRCEALDCYRVSCKELHMVEVARITSTATTGAYDWFAG